MRICACARVKRDLVCLDATRPINTISVIHLFIPQFAFLTVDKHTRCSVFTAPDNHAQSLTRARARECRKCTFMGVLLSAA